MSKRTWGLLGTVILAGLLSASLGMTAVPILLFLVLTTLVAARASSTAAAIGSAVLAWAMLSLFVGVLAFYISIPMRPLYVVLLGGASALMVLRLPTRRERRSEARRVDAGFIASFTGAALWVAGLIVAAIRPAGSAVSWAVHDDSSLDVWATTTILSDQGLQTTNVTNPRPLEHLLTSTFVPGRTITDHSGLWMQDVLLAHATNWFLAVVIGTVLAGLVSAQLTRAVLRRGSPAVWLAAALASSVMLLGPSSGFFMFRGQINGNITMMLLFASVAIALDADTDKMVAFRRQVVAMVLIALMWTPFAAVPGLLACVIAVRHRSVIFSRPHLLAIPNLLVLGFSLWALVVFNAGLVLSLIGRGSDGREAAVRVETYLQAPMSWWMTLALVLPIIAVTVTFLARKSNAGSVLVTTLAGLVLGALPLFLARGSLTGTLEYYPSRYIHMSEVMLSPIAVAAVCAIVAIGTWVRRLVAVTAVAVATTSSLNADLPVHVQQWTPVPILVAQGTYFGPDSSVYENMVRYADDPGLRLPMHFDVPHDDPVRRMLSVDLIENTYQWNDPLRSALRNRRDDGIDRVCEIANATKLPVTFETRNPELERLVEGQCDFSRPGDVSFVLIQD